MTAAARIALAAVALAAVVSLPGGGHDVRHRAGALRGGGDGRDEREPVVKLPTIQAAFDEEGYRAGETAHLVIFDRARDVRLRLYRVGTADGPLAPATMRGRHVGGTRTFAALGPGRSIALRLDPAWESGVWFAELTAPGGRVGYAPFVLAPRRLGAHRTAVVIPTQTWQAYNFRDGDRDGHPDTWYAPDVTVATASLDRPFENRGVPPHFRTYDEPFLRWLDGTDDAVDYVSDRDLRRTTGSTLARAYDLMIFEGHHEYATRNEMRAVTGFRNRGGNLMFLSANTFFWRITIDHGVMTRTYRWRRLHHDEAALVGAHYVLSSARPGGAWVVRDTPAAAWIFDGTGLTPGATFSYGGVEVDHTARRSPANVQVVAEIPDVFGSGRSAQMTYYRHRSGAQVFAAGAFSLAAAVSQPAVQTVLENLVEHLSGVRPAPRTPTVSEPG